MKVKKYIPPLIYLLLVLVCLAAVFLAGRLAKPPGGAGQEGAAPSGEAPSKGSSPEEESRPLFWEEEETEAPARPPFGKTPLKPGREDTQEAPQETEESPYVPPWILLASDIHYMSKTTHDGGEAFRQMEASDDGKINGYSDMLVDTLVEEAIAQKPSALVLAGDITHNGERENHLGLAEKLRRAKEAGVPVLVVPGNHDINNRNAATYFGSEKAAAQYLEAGQDFLEIYHEFGYGQAFSRDPASLSYFYALDDTHWILMLDTCQYEGYNQVSGRLKPETMAWAEGYLDQAMAQGVEVLPVGHHNLLSESRLYTVECTMENHQDVIRMWAKYGLPLYVSGHLHAQRIKKHKAEPGVPEGSYGVAEVVLPPYGMAPCQYGCLEWEEGGGMKFWTKQADVAAYAAAQGSRDENLLCFGRYGPEFTKAVVKEQAKKTINAMPEDLKEEMASLYSQVYFDYCAGNRVCWDEARATRAYRLWERVAPDSRYIKEMWQMAEDAKQDLHNWSRE